MQIFLVWIILILGAFAIAWLLRRSRSPTGEESKGLYPVVSRDQANIDPYPYVFVNSDGSVRELHPGERELLETPFHPADGARPYVKGNYSAKDGWGDLKGFCRRIKIPSTIAFLPAPSENPNKPLSREEFADFLRSKGMDVTENPDGTLTTHKPVR